MTLKLLSEWDETFCALLLKSFMIEAVPYLWDSCSVAAFVMWNFYFWCFPTPKFVCIHQMKIFSWGEENCPKCAFWLSEPA